MDDIDRIKNVLEDVTIERLRQIEEKGFTPEHDDEHSRGELADAGGCYALFGDRTAREDYLPDYWPFEPAAWQPSHRRWNLVRAAALIVAEIERLDRASESTNHEG